MTLTVVEFPQQNACFDLPASLRKLADQIENGEFDDAHNLAWVVDCGNSRIELGYLGKASEPACAAHFLFALAQRRLELGALDQTS